MKIMHQIDYQKDIAYNREVNNVNAGLIDSDSDLDYLVMITLVLDDPNCDRNKKISVFIDIRLELFMDFIRLKEGSVNSS